MFDIGFWEMLLLCALGLVVLGPKRLPEVALKIGSYLGKLARWLTRSLDKCARRLN